VRIGMKLEHVAGELDNRHPAARGYMYSTNHLDMALHDTLGTYFPPRICTVAICHAFLKWNSINDSDYGRSQTLTSKNLSTEVPTCFMNRPRVIGFRPKVSSRVGIWRLQLS
jgi:hypothetical protein